MAPNLSAVAFVGLLLVTVLNVAFTTYSTAQLQRLLPPPPREYTWEGDDFPAQLPIPQDVVGLNMLSGVPYFTLHADDEWATLFPSDGFTPLGPNGRPFEVSMVHQLHCLDVIRVGFVTNGTDAPGHILHCLRQLRQAVLCLADRTLEATEEKLLPDGSTTHGASGVDMVHRCHDWTVVHNYLEAHRTPDFVHI